MTRGASRHAGARALLLVAVSLMTALPAAAQGWTSLPELLEARQEIAAAVLDGELVVAGGFSVQGRALASVEAYRPGAGWRSLSAMPIAVHHPAAAVVDGLLYVIGGFPGGGLSQATDAVQIYDPLSATWRLGTPMPSPAGGLAAAALGERIVVVGGAHHGASLPLALNYHPASDSWSELPPLPTARDHLGLAELGGRLHAVGGRNQRSFTLNAHEVYDPASNSWSSLAPLPTGRSGHALVAAGGCLIALGGEGNNARRDGIFTEVEAFDPATGAWTALAPMATARHGMAAAAFEGSVIVVAGAAVAGFGALALVDAFTPPTCQ